jgi:hypothetical protein
MSLNDRLDKLVEHSHRMEQPAGLGKLTVGDLWALIGACARDSQQWETKAARIKGESPKSQETRKEHLFQAKAYTDLSSMLHDAIKEVEGR